MMFGTPGDDCRPISCNNNNTVADSPAWNNLSYQGFSDSGNGGTNISISAIISASCVLVDDTDYHNTNRHYLPQLQQQQHNFPQSSWQIPCNQDYTSNRIQDRGINEQDSFDCHFESSFKNDHLNANISHGDPSQNWRQRSDHPSDPTIDRNDTNFWREDITNNIPSQCTSEPLPNIWQEGRYYNDNISHVSREFEDNLNSIQVPIEQVEDHSNNHTIVYREQKTMSCLESQQCLSHGDRSMEFAHRERKSGDLFTVNEVPSCALMETAANTTPVMEAPSGNVHKPETKTDIQNYDVPVMPIESQIIPSKVEIDVDHMLSNGVTVAGYKPRPIIRKKRKKPVVQDQKNLDYWNRRIKNNDSARKSREAKKEKERVFYKQALQLEYENYFLKERILQLENQLGITAAASTNADTCNQTLEF